MSDIYNDGALSHGSAVLTITPATGSTPARSDASAFDAIADPTFNLEPDINEVNQTDENGSYNGGFGIRQRTGGSCSIQLPGTRRAYDGDTFVVDITGNDFITAGTTLLQISKASHPYTKDGYRVQDITYFIRKYALDNTTANTPVIYG